MNDALIRQGLWPWITGMLLGALVTGLVMHFTLSGEVAGLRADVQHLLRAQTTLQQRVDDLRAQLASVWPRPGPD